MKAYDCKIVLEDGSEYFGYRFGSIENRVCEIVFNTSMVGYQEIVSDPSYTDQMVAMTYPLIGNYGTTDEDFETKLFDRTSKMLANSGAKVLVDESLVDGDVNTSIKVDKNYMKSWLEDKRREELANLISVKNKIEENQEDDIEELKEDEFNARSLLLGQILMNRKKTTKH